MGCELVIERSEMESDRKLAPQVRQKVEIRYHRREGMKYAGQQYL